MNRFLAVALVAGVALVVGCQKSEPGGMGGNDTFKIVVPVLSTAVNQGEVQLVRISVERGAGFKQAVKLEIKAPAGLQVDPDSTTVKLGDKGDVQAEDHGRQGRPPGRTEDHGQRHAGRWRARGD